MPHCLSGLTGANQIFVRFAAVTIRYVFRNRTSSVSLSEDLVGGDYTYGMVHVGVYVHSATAFPSTYSVVTVNAWNVDPSIACTNDCNGRGQCRNGQCACYAQECLVGPCEQPATASCAYGCNASCAGVTLCRSG